MPIKDDLYVLVTQLEGLLAELDRLELPSVAVHIDLALRRLEDIIRIGAAD